MSNCNCMKFLQIQHFPTFLPISLCIVILCPLSKYPGTLFLTNTYLFLFLFIYLNEISNTNNDILQRNRTAISPSGLSTLKWHWKYI